MDKLPVNDLIEELDKELTPRYSRYYRCESSTQSSFENGVDAGIRDARQAMIKVLQDYRYKHPSIIHGENLIQEMHEQMLPKELSTKTSSTEGENK